MKQDKRSFPSKDAWCGSANTGPSGATWLKKSGAVLLYSGGVPVRVPDLAVSPVSICACTAFFFSDSPIRLFSAARRLHRAEVLYGEPVPLPGIILADNHERARPLEP